MEFAEFIAGENDSNRRADRVLRKFLPSLPLSRLYSGMRTGLIKINEKKCKPDARIFEGDRLKIANFLLESKTGPEYAQPEELPQQEIVFKNEHLLIVNKPSNIAVHGGKDGGLAALAAGLFKPKSGSMSFSPAPLHRLDRKTTGLLVFSQSIRGAHWFSQAVKMGKIGKTYRAIVCGALNENLFWQDRLLKNEQSGGFYTVRQDKDGSLAQTRVKPLVQGSYREKPVTLAEYDILTGKTHQIRAQSALHGYPLLGDTAYGGQKHGETQLAQDFFLHAAVLRFPPDNPLGLPAEIRAPVSEIFRQMCRLCLLDYDN